uniref:Uncharacterized protein n=1 Tax=Parascaris equorum TaxID=6256 RepID=A0A914RWS7_PAREQ
MLIFRLQKYDSDDDHFLSLPEAQILADEIFDMGPDTTATLLDGVDHRKAKKINELELVDFLSDLREEAAIAALDKLTNANIDPIEYVSMQNLISMWNRESASSKDSSKKRRIITVTMPRSPELEALIEARKQQDAKSFYRNNNQPKRVRLARQAG